MPLSRPLFVLGVLALAACGTTTDGPPAGTGGASGNSGFGGTSSSGGASNPSSGGQPQTGGATSGGATSGGATLGSGGASSGGMTTTGGAGGNNTAGAATGGSNAGGTTTATGGANTSGGSASSTGGAAGNSTSGGAKASGGANANGGANISGGATASGGTSGGAAGSAGRGGASGGQTNSGGSAGAAGVYRPCPTNGSPCKIMPFGDSITDGYGNAGGYRVELFRLAHQAGKNITFVGTQSNSPGMVDGVTFPPNHEGHSGFTIAPGGGREGISPLVAIVMPQFTPHIVTLMIGTNDAYVNYEMASAPTRLGALIDSIFAELPNVLLVVAQATPMLQDAPNTRIKTYNAAIPAVIKTRADAGRHILLVDMYTPIAPNKATLLKDNWHPDDAGYKIMGARWYSVLSPSL